ncbi:hypothetical protein LTS18_001212, partial [Coniosporium uncinatum]
MSLRGSTGPTVLTRPHLLNGQAKGLAAGMRPSKLYEPDEMVLQTERIITELGESAVPNEPLDTETVTNAATKVRSLWTKFSPNRNHGEASGSIGPTEDGTPLAKAEFVGSLLLGIHHPAIDSSPQAQSSRNSRFALQLHNTTQATPVAKFLLDWLNAHHDPSAPELEALLSTTDGYSAADNFWDVIFTCIFRGKFDAAVRLLKGADFSVAETALADGYTEMGYTGRALESIRLAVNQMIEILQSSPALTSNDWDTRGHQWSLFRRKVEEIRADLQEFAEGDSKDRDADEEEHQFQAKNFGITGRSSGGLGLSTRSRHAESKVPWSVYEALIDIYGQLLGGTEDVLKSAYDWVEATIGLA